MLFFDNFIDWNQRHGYSCIREARSAMRRRSGKPSNSNENQLYLLGELYNLIVEYTTVGTVKNKHEIL